MRRPSTSSLMLRFSWPILLMNATGGSTLSSFAILGLMRMTFCQAVLESGSGASASQPLLAERPSPACTLGTMRTSRDLAESSGALKAAVGSANSISEKVGYCVPARTPSANQAAKAVSAESLERLLKVSRTSAYGSWVRPAKGARTSSSVTVGKSGSIIGWTGT